MCTVTGPIENKSLYNPVRSFLSVHARQQPADSHKSVICPSGYICHCAEDATAALLELTADDEAALLPDVTAEDDVTELPDTEVDEDDEEATSSV